MKLNLLSIVNLSAFLLYFGCVGGGSHDSNRVGPGLDLSKSYERIESNFSYRNLALLDLDQMSDMLQAKINSESNQRESAFIALARPNEDSVLEKVISIARDPLEENSDWQNTIETLVRQSADDIKNQNQSAVKQVTAGVILENIISEFKPAFIKQLKSGGFESDVIYFIAESNLKYSKAANKERSLNLMRSDLNPSELAQKLISLKKNHTEK